MSHWGRPGSGERELTGVLRGGSWGNNNPDNLRAANRNNDHPGNRNNNYGFRVVVSVGEFRKADTMRTGVVPAGKTFCPAGAKKPSLTPPATPRARGEKTRRRAVAGRPRDRKSRPAFHGARRSRRFSSRRATGTESSARLAPLDSEAD